MILAYVKRVWQREDSCKWSSPLLIGKEGIEKYEYSLFSQNGEDGILRYLFSEIGFTSRSFLEFGFGVVDNSCLRLVLKEGLAGVFIDGSETSVKLFNCAAQQLGISQARAIHAFLNLDNLERTIVDSGVPRDIDLLSIDVDGNDYWFWKNLKCVSPRVAVIEYNASFGPVRSCSVYYDPHFDRHRKHPTGLYYGASLTALTRLGAELGYGLVGCDSNGINAFFVREDCLTKNLPVMSSEAAYRPHRA